ncbi:MAG: hypothetical protein WCS75_00005, partial [Sphingomonas sp.]
MPNDPKTDLIYAIMAMDAYNRGYGAGIKGLGEIGSLGNWDILTTSTDEFGQRALNAGFYAVAYRNAVTGETIISYRGTDANIVNPLGDEGSDILNGYGLAVGDINAPQAILAAQFYDSVVQAAGGGTVTTTGHSLGGGLAGYVAAVAGGRSVLFDNMPFGIAAMLKAQQLGITAQIGKASSYSVEGEFLSDARSGDLQKAIGSDLSLLPFNDAWQQLGNDIGDLTRQFEQPISKYPAFDPGDDALGMFQRHSMDLLVALLWAKAENETDWQGASEGLWTAFFDAHISNTLSSAQDISGRSDANAVLRDAIAYSAIGPSSQSDAKPFGDTAIWSMFNDAGELGRILSDPHSSFFENTVTFRSNGFFSDPTKIDVKQWLADISVQYAGALALNDVEQVEGGRVSTPSGAVDVRQGVLALSENDSILSIDLSSVLWKDALKGKDPLEASAVDPIDAGKFRELYFKQGVGDTLDGILNRLGVSTPDELAKKFWKATDGHVIDRFTVLTTDQQGGDFTIAPRSYDAPVVLGDQAHVDMFVASTGDDHITGTSGHDIIIGNGGSDDIDAGAGNDIILASGGIGSSVRGGIGRDFIVNTSIRGEIWGDTESGYYEKLLFDADGNPLLNADGSQQTALAKVEDSEANSDLFWFAPDVTIKDAQVHDRLVFQGIALTGGDRNPAYSFALGGAISSVASGSLNAFGFGNALAGAIGGAAAAAGIFFDKLLPFIVYQFTPTGVDEDGNQVGTLKIGNIFTGLDRLINGTPSGGASNPDLQGVMVVENFKMEKSFWGYEQAALAENGTLGMSFKEVNPLDLALAVTGPLLRASLLTAGQAIVLQSLLQIDYIVGFTSALASRAKTARWFEDGDPLIIDLDGDGIETTSLDGSKVYFDVDGDGFAERTGWLKSDDGFLVLDANGNGRIDSIAEMFGGVGASGFAELASYDTDGDGRITVADAVWGSLQVWRDLNGDGITEDGELKSLNDLGIVSLGVTSNSLDLTTPQGTRLTGYGDVTLSNGSVRRMFDAAFASSDVDTRYAGESGQAAWQSDQTIDAKGFGTITNLSVATANDISLAKLVADTAAGMTSTNLKDLVGQAGAVLGAWGQALEQTRELMPVLVAVDAQGKATLVDRGVYVEDAQGGYWTLASGAPVLDAQGHAITRATLQDVLAQGAGWHLEQTWSPSDRASALQFRDDAPYLVKIVDGRAVVLDYGIKQSDGSWKLASDPNTSYASKNDILALGHPTGTEWRSEEIGFNPYANLPVDRIGVRITDGVVVDYTVQVTDQDGTFYVWARNLDRALQLEWKTGDSREFNLRNYAVDFDHLDEVGSTDDSAYRVEIMTPGEFQFATSLGGIDFRPEILSATLDNTTGHIDYAVNQTGSANLSTDPNNYISGISAVIDLLQPVMQQYITASRRFAVRLALQGGLKGFAQGIT